MRIARPESTSTLLPRFLTVIICSTRLLFYHSNNILPKQIIRSLSTMHPIDFEQSLLPDTRIHARETPRTLNTSSMTDQKSSVICSYLTAELSHNKWVSVPPMRCFISGLVDAVAFNTWGCFAGMQTGKVAPSYVDENTNN